MHNLKQLRIKAGLCQSDLAKTLGISRTTVSMWEIGAGFPRADKLPELAKILDCSIDDLFEERG